MESKYTADRVGVQTKRCGAATKNKLQNIFALVSKGVKWILHGNLALLNNIIHKYQKCYEDKFI
jgi:hypothetical protein